MEKQLSVGTGSIVKIERHYVSNNEFNGYYRITSIRGNKANLGSIFGKTIYHKRVPLEWLVECHDEWYETWSHSESYMCM